MDLPHVFLNSDVFLIVVTLLGLLIGSFLTVVIYRLPIMIYNQEETSNLTSLTRQISPLAPFNLWTPRSFCFHCKEKLPAWVNLPLVGFLLLRGKTHCCQKRIPATYLTIEILSAILALLLAIQFGVSLEFGFGIVLIFGLLALTFIDIDTLLLPDQITLPLLWLGLFCNLFNIFTSLQNAILGALCGYFFFFLMSFLMLKIRKVEGLGGGDLKLVALLGAWLGCQLLPVIIFIASLTGSLFGFYYILRYKKHMTVQLPFGPFLAIGGLITLFYRESLLHYELTILPNQVIKLFYSSSR